ncbi:MAG: putative DNA binding domain-containing protein [Clostridiales bacterium]|jgi:ATP-dependent DNA helicase RecG|nr:putative DNA binding domain-containing protein [Clostridiales bacterium]
MNEESLVGLARGIQLKERSLKAIELKSAAAGCPNSLYDTLSAFSNQNGGGVILFGLDEEKGHRVVGVYDPDNLKLQVESQCSEMEPAILPLFTTAEIDGKTIVAAEIPPANIPERPVFYKGLGRLKGAWVRVGSANEPINEYEVFRYDAFRRRIHDDLRIVESATLSSLSTYMVKKCLSTVRKENLSTSSMADDKLLGLMGVARDGKPTLAGVMCFSAHPQAIFRQLCVVGLVVPGTSISTGERFTESRRIEGTIKEMVENATLFVERNMRRKNIPKNGRRVEKPEYPLPAIRESIINALMHRDYSPRSEGVPVRITMFSDRLEIRSEGALFGHLGIEKLGRAKMDTRNETIASILETQKVVENRYSGISTIYRAMREHNLPDPIFQSVDGYFQVTLLSDYGKRISRS